MPRLPHCMGEKHILICKGIAKADCRAYTHCRLKDRAAFEVFEASSQFPLTCQTINVDRTKD